MKRDLELLAPLIDQLGRLFSALENGDLRAADRMISAVESMWPDIPPMAHTHSEEDDIAGFQADARSDLLLIVVNVGSVAEALLAETRSRRTLTRLRADLIADLRRFNASANL